MQAFRYFLFGQLVISLAVATSSGDEPALTTDAMLTEWEAASRQIQEMDARFNRLEGDRMLRNDKWTSGRFYWESSEQGFYETASLDRHDSIIWNVDRLCIIEQARNRKNFVRCATAEVQEARKHLDELDALSGWQSLLHCFDRLRWFPGYVAKPDDVLPLCTKVEAKTIQKQFDVRWREDDDKIIVTALPNDKRSARIRQIEVMLKRGSYKLLAHRIVDTNGRYVVHVFDEVKLNNMPADREARMNPNLDGFSPLYDCEAVRAPVPMPQ
jgi:hypothetical protein